MESIPDKAHIARHVTPSRMPNGEAEPRAFHLRLHETALSVNHLEHWGAGDQLTQLQKIYETSSVEHIGIEGREYGNNDCFAVLNVGDLRSKLRRHTGDPLIDIVQDPLGKNESHALVVGLEAHRNDDAIPVIIASCVLFLAHVKSGARF